MEFMIDDTKVESLYPITLTRAGFNIVIGGYDLYSLLKEYFPGCKIAYKTRPYIEKILKRTCPCENIEEKKAIVLSSRTVPSLENMKKISSGKKNLEIIKYPHESIVWNKKVCKDNLIFMSKKFGEQSKGVFIGKEVNIHKSCVLDATEGPIIIDENAKILPFTYIKGPAYIGKKTIVKEHSSIKDCTIICNICKVGGEIEGSIISDYSNKQHLGFIGNSFIGSWVNLGAGTSNSDLKNTYGEITVTDGERKKIKTGEQFLGCVVGDYSKTAINTSIYTGKRIGANASILGTVSEDIPSFVVLNKDKAEEFLMKKALETQKRVLERRNLKQSPQDKRVLEKTFDISAKERKKFL